MQSNSDIHMNQNPAGMKSGTVFWITGLAGAGKTTLGKALCSLLRQEKPNVIFLDGDVLRGIFGTNTGHTIEERKELGMSYARLCKMLSEQGMDVVCATMSLFREIHDFNRKNITNYLEVFIECEVDELIRRDQKGIYSRAMKGELQDVIGINSPYDHPGDCELTIDNSRKDNVEEKVRQILKQTTLFKENQ